MPEPTATPPTATEEAQTATRMLSASGAAEPGDTASASAVSEPPALDQAELDLESAPARRRPRLLWAPLVVLAAAALVAAGFGLRGLAGGAPGDDSVDAGFLRDMTEHHAQAVQMSMLEFSHGADENTIAISQDIALGQQREIGVMGSWLADWGLGQSTVGEPMRWMGGTGAAADGHDMAGMHDGSGSLGTPVGTDGVRMPGMASGTELTQLASSQGRDSDVRFLTLMIHHHRGGIIMAQFASQHASEDKVRALAKAMVTVQSWDISQMQFDLQRLGAPPA
ncbi:DUF305 domain-containing protein [Pseudofrankia sp. BMG5.36]|uniref:DUF305 domain-containing protein n=1 Tax=Pseudofrankia sp. BMG5.36 TaxID=1834512 RepID=UPI0009F20672|nr:DUF305 domain-containing protein [Pseudofrankia sp. BMG5.36]